MLFLKKILVLWRIIHCIVLNIYFRYMCLTNYGASEVVNLCSRYGEKSTKCVELKCASSLLDSSFLWCSTFQDSRTQTTSKITFYLKAWRMQDPLRTSRPQWRPLEAASTPTVLQLASFRIVQGPSPALHELMSRLVVYRTIITDQNNRDVCTVYCTLMKIRHSYCVLFFLGPYTERIDLWFETFFLLTEIMHVIEWLREIKTADQWETTLLYIFF